MIATGAHGIEVTNDLVLINNLFDAPTNIYVNTGATAYVLSDEDVTYGGPGTVAPLPSDRAVWNALTYPARHTNDTDAAAGIHHTLADLNTRYLSPSLPVTEIFVGNEQGQATAVTLSGDGELDSGGGLTLAPEHRAHTWLCDGALAVVTNAGLALIIAGGYKLDRVYIQCKTLGMSGTTIIDVNRNGTTLFTDQTQRPQLAYNDSDGVAVSGLPDATTLTTNDVLTFDIDQIAAGAKDLSVLIVLKGMASGALLALRSFIINQVWSGDGPPTTGATSVTTGVSSPLSSDSSNLASVDRLTITMTKSSITKTVQPYVFRPTTSNHRLVLVHYGHTTDWEADGMGNTVRALIDDGNTVVGIMMIDGGSTATHNTYPAPTATINYLRFFLDPCVRSINQLIGEGFYRIDMVGLSGGGWTVHMLAAVERRISRSIGVAGSLPLDRGTGGPGARDWEQLLPALDSTVLYEDLYVLSADYAGRRTMQLLNTNDSCCFTQAAYNSGSDYAPDVAARAAKEGGHYQLTWDTNSSHSISANGLSIIRAEFNG